MTDIFCLLIVMAIFSCGPKIESEEINRNMEGFRSFLEGVPISSDTKDSLVAVAVRLDSVARKELISKLESDHSEAIELQRKHEARILQIRSQFDPRTSAHFKVQQSVQESMNDPNSFEHVSTSYSEHPDHLMVDMHFRMPVSPGVTMMHRIVAKVDLEGNVLDGEVTRTKE